MGSGSDLHHVFGIKYQDDETYRKYQENYVAFKKSLRQYADGAPDDVTTTNDLTVTNDLKVSSTTIPYTYYLSEQTKGNPSYCDGVNMDSAGYKSTLIRKVTVIVSGTLPRDLTNQDKIKNTLQLAADAEPFSAVYTRIASTTFENNNHTIVMHFAYGWAGSSIFYCKWKPFVERNMEQFPEVTEIKWEPVN